MSDFSKIKELAERYTKVVAVEIDRIEHAEQGRYSRKIVNH